MKNKVIKDNVHGYINIPEEYCAIIDTSEFQRLRSIEQTSMRCLYPCAGHDRFTHSLGTFYLGQKLIRALVRNLTIHNEKYFKLFDEEEWNRIIKTFELACMLHDCGHAPFSHTLEKYMDYPFEPADGKDGLLVRQLINEIKDVDSVFADKKLLESYTSKHEKATAILIWKRFRKDIESLGADTILVMRMIMGYRYSPAANDKEKMLNCIIALLNGMHIDVDKLDYIVRDTATSGVDNFSMDLDRLINSVIIVNHKNTISVGYLKTSINVIPNIISAMNNLYLWIYAHHKVQYHSWLLCRCFEKAVGILFGYAFDKEKDKILAKCSHLISVDAMIGPIEVSSSTYTERAYLPSDFDIMALIKKAALKTPDSDFDELFSRVYKKSVWKSYAEYYNLFQFNAPQMATIYANSGSRSTEILDNLCAVFPKGHILNNKESWAIFQVKPKVKSTDEAGIYIHFNNGVLQEYSSKTFASAVTGELPAFFYLYHTKAEITEEEKEEIIKVIQSFAS